jgi:short-subunit dehydrogenase
MPHAIVTGATQGIGKAIAEKFLSEGFSVAICARSKDDLLAAEKEWKAQYPSATIITHQADLSVKEEAIAFANAVLKQFPTVEVLVNNAGLYFPGLLSTEPDGQLEKLMAVNLYSAYHITRHLLPGMKKAKAGHIFNMCSIASLRAYPNGGAYSITKYALLGFSDNLRLELVPDNIKVTSICPGATYSRSWSQSGVSPDRLMTTQDIADTVWSAYKLSPQANIDTLVIRPQQGDL